MWGLYRVLMVKSFTILVAGVKVRWALFWPVLRLSVLLIAKTHHTEHSL